MDKKLIVNSIGYVLKKEKLATLASQHSFHELVLEDLDQFPGFYDHYFIPANEGEKQPRSIFIVLRELESCKEDAFIRMTMKIKKKCSIYFNAALATLQLFNKPMLSIRVFMDDYDGLPELISYYKKEGISFHSRKDIKPFQSLIEIRKYFELEVLDKGIYKDLDQADTYYLQVPAYLNWDIFESMTITIRNNMSHKLYDAAQAAIYEKPGILDLVRIYDKKNDLEFLKLLSQKYIREFERL